MRTILAFIVVFFAVSFAGSPLWAEVILKPKGVCGGSYFQEYLEERGTKAFAYAEDPSTGQFACAYQHGVNSGFRARDLALRGCKKDAKKAGISARCRIVAKGNKILWDDRSAQDEEVARWNRIEVAHWNRIKNESRSVYFEKFLKRYPNSQFSSLARSRIVANSPGASAIEEIAYWNRIKNSSDARFFEFFLESYPGGRFTALARSRHKELRGQQTAVAATSTPEMEIAYWNRIKKYNDAHFFEFFLERYPDGQFAALARSRLKTLTGGEVASTATDTTAPVIYVPDEVDIKEAITHVRNVADAQIMIDLGSKRIGTGFPLEIAREWLGLQPALSSGLGS